MSNQNVSTPPPEDESDERVISQETLLDEVIEGFIGKKTNNEALDEVIEEFGRRLSNDEIRKLFD